MLDLDQERVALAAAGADRGEAEAAAVAAQVVHHRPDDPAAGGADRMAERDRAAVHVHLLLVRAQKPRRVPRDRRERLVDLDALDVVDRLPAPLERDRARLRRRPREEGEVVGDVPLREHGRERLDSAPPRPLLARHDHAGGAVVHTRRVAGGRRALGVEYGLQGCELFERGVAPRALVGRDSVDADDLVLEAAGVHRRNGALVRAVRPLVLILARDPELARDERRLLDSIPPVTTTSTSPARIIESAISTARIDDAQTLLIVSAGTSIGSPAATAA